MDDDIALRAASKVSSAHVNSFLQNGAIVIRNVLPSSINEATVLARAVVCRLLEAPACCISPDGVSSDVFVLFPSRQITVLGFDVGPNDVLVVSANDVGTMDAQWNEALCACSSDEEGAIFKDSLYGTRGETPTTVIQWSKGTIF